VSGGARIVGVLGRWIWWCLSCGLLLWPLPNARGAALPPPDAPAHGLWVWQSPSVLEAPRGAETLRDFCRSNGITEVYLSVSATSGNSEDGELARLVALLHRSRIRVEALLSSTDGDEPGKPRERLLDQVRRIVRFNQQHHTDPFDGIHLDVEPQQRPENKGTGNLKFLPDLVDSYAAVRAVAEPARITVNADIQNKLLKGNLAERKLLLSSLPRLTLMLYELSDTTDGESAARMADKVTAKSREFLAMAYQGLDAANLATMMVGLRTPDYGSRLPQMLDTLDASNGANPHYAGWARHSYNDYLRTVSATSR
jgi:hypothetical protein